MEEDVREQRPLYIIGGHVYWQQLFERRFAVFLENLNCIYTLTLQFYCKVERVERVCQKWAILTII